MLILFVFWLLLNRNEALPISERDTPHPSALSTYTSTRSVYSVVWSCLITTFLCAWVSIHPNTLPKLGGTSERVGVRVRLFLLALFAPEIVVGLATLERRAADKMINEFREEGLQISMTHAHLIVMGSFALCYPEARVLQFRAVNEKSAEHSEKEGEASKMVRGVEESGSRNEQVQEVSRNMETEESPQNKELLIMDDDSLAELRYIETISGRRFLDLLRQLCIKFPPMPPCELKDRSKTDGLSRFITAVQVMWFVVQCVVRHVQGLAITHLELTTLALASLNAFMLWLWRDKPHCVDVQVPVYLLGDSDEWEKRTAEWEERKAEVMRRKEEEQQRKEEEKTLSIWSKCWRSVITMCRLIRGIWKGFWDGFLARGQQKLESTPSPSPHLDKPVDPGPELWAEIKKIPPFVRVVVMAILVVVCLITLGAFVAGFVLALVLSPVAHVFLKSRHVHDFVTRHLLNRRSSLLRDQIPLVSILSQALFVGVAFGGLHCAGWNFAFPTTTEQTLWRAMSLVLAVAPILSSTFVSGFAQFYKTDISFVLALSASYALLSAITVFAYVIARLCILALALELVRNEPESAYFAVNWTKAFPHVSSS